MNANKKAVLVGCSDPLPPREREEIRRLPPLLAPLGVEVTCSPLLFSDALPSPAEKAEALNRQFRDPAVDFIFDVSGGDLANTVLPFLDWAAIRVSRAVYFGFSDLTTVINAIIAKTGRPAVNYQIRNLLYADAAAQLQQFARALLPGRLDAALPPPQFLRGSRMEGRVFGGNIRCFLKLAGTPYWPEMTGGILLLESLGGGVYQMMTALEQYRQLGVFETISGILLGTFTAMEAQRQSPPMETLVLQMTPDRLPVAKTRFVGHGPDARAIPLGQTLCFSAETGGTQ